MAERKLYLSNKLITILFIYYLILFIIGIISSIAVIEDIFNLQLTITLKSILGGIGMTLSGSSIYYTRKLYKTSFQNGKIEIASTSNYKEKLATMVYFLSRPLFSIVFTILLIIGIKSGIVLATESTVDLSERFIYLIMFFSFFLGFSSGKFINKLESKGSILLDKTLKED